MRHKPGGNHGFTLIEVIITLIMVSIAGTMLVTALGTGLTHSPDSIVVLGDNLDLVRAIESVNADYRQNLEDSPSQSMDAYKGDLSGISGVPAGVTVTGKYIGFTDPDGSKKVSETVSAGTMYIKVTAVKNSSTLVTIIGN